MSATPKIQPIKPKYKWRIVHVTSTDAIDFYVVEKRFLFWWFIKRTNIGTHYEAMNWIDIYTKKEDQQKPNRKITYQT